MNQLLALIEVHLRIVARKPIAGSADGKALLVEQTADLPDDQTRLGAGNSAGYRAA